MEPPRRGPRIDPGLEDSHGVMFPYSLHNLNYFIEFNKGGVGGVLTTLKKTINSAFDNMRDVMAVPGGNDSIIELFLEVGSGGEIASGGAEWPVTESVQTTRIP